MGTDTTPPTVDAAPSPSPAVGHEPVAVLAALNRAADDILDAVNAGDEGLRDALNLMVNATAAYLDGTATDLPGVVENGYDADYDEVLDWISTAC